MAVVAGRSTRSLEVMRNVVVALAMTIICADALACSCIERPSTWVSDSANIFYAEIVSAALTNEKRLNSAVVVARFRLIEKFRGAELKELRTITDDGLCGYPFVVGANLI